MGLLYKIVLKEPKFLDTLSKYLKKKNARPRTYFYFLAMLNNISEDDENAEKIIEWLKQEGLLSEGFSIGKGDDNK